jgi:transposase
MSTTHLSPLSLIQTYKAQRQTIEGNKRFLKDSRLYAESLFLKKESRIMALVTIMAMALLIYSLGEERLVSGKPSPP